MTYLKVSMCDLVIPASALPELEALVKQGVKLVEADYNHRVGGKYVHYVDPTRAFDCVQLAVVDSGKVAVMQMYYEEKVRGND